MVKFWSRNMFESASTRSLGCEASDSSRDSSSWTLKSTSTRSVGCDVSDLSSWTDDGFGDAVPEIREVEEEVEEVQLQRRPRKARDLARRFEKCQGLVANVEKIATEAKAVDHINQEISNGEAEFQTLRRILVALRGRMEGRTKGDVDKALDTVDSLETKYIQRGTELAQERGEVNNLSLLFKQASNDTKAMLEDTRSVAWEIASTKENITKLQNDLQEQEKVLAANDKKELEELKRQAFEARRIKMLHESSRAMDMEHEIGFLRQQLLEKAAETVTLRRLVELMKERRLRDGKSLWFELDGEERLGSTLNIVPVKEIMRDPSECTIQWYQITDDGAIDVISGAIRSQYAPDPFNVGKILRAAINLPGGASQTVQTSGPIRPARDLDNYVDTLVSKGSAQFNARIVLKNGEAVERQFLHVLELDRTRIKVYRMHTVKANEIYSKAMQLCGARGGGDSAAQGLYWVPKKDQNFMLVLDSERERNAAIMLARKFAKQQSIPLGGPGDLPP
ncbi:unnamed protein product [Calypogeia fissa]